ncbi:hypothetical protein L323_08585 [Ruminiclostridium papyrosolvens C7]|uniref:Uncharacterized protein n=1 Tax=Ruminiclostridium papyrosolvens C7 TaxID=1330534 RepID=U4R254_9FIRM|nr:hypothetical protein L323_08585 [Ruminiclostridium papyrosolvens C7]
MLINYLLRELGNEIKNHEQIKKRKLKRRQEKQRKKTFIINTFGKGRYYLGYLFGSWVWYSCNNNFYEKKIAEPSIPQPSSKVLYLSSFR